MPCARCIDISHYAYLLRCTGGDITRWYLVATLQSRPWERQTYVTVLAPGQRAPHCKFGTRDLHLFLGVSKYVSDRVRYFSYTSFSLDLESRWR